MATVITYRIVRGTHATNFRAQLCAPCARNRTDLGEVLHGRHAGTCDDCDTRAQKGK
jgi:hypothetical protein